MFKRYSLGALVLAILIMGCSTQSADQTSQTDQPKKDYYFTKTVDYSFEEAIEKVRSELKAEGFGIITQIDLKAAFKEKLELDFYNYKILGACNPNFAYQALQKEDKIGTMLPCNVIVQEKSAGVVEVAAIDPVASMIAVDNPDLVSIAVQVQAKLKKVVEAL